MSEVYGRCSWRDEFRDFSSGREIRVYVNDDEAAMTNWLMDRLDQQEAELAVAWSEARSNLHNAVHFAKQTPEG